MHIHTKPCNVANFLTILKHHLYSGIKIVNLAYLNMLFLLVQRITILVPNTKKKYF